MNAETTITVKAAEIVLRDAAKIVVALKEELRTVIAANTQSKEYDAYVDNRIAALEKRLDVRRPSPADLDHEYGVAFLDMDVENRISQHLA